MTFNEMKALLQQYGVEPGNTITFEKHSQLFNALRARDDDKWHGTWLMDCFMPEGEPMEPGYEDSLSHYTFLFNTWEEFAGEFNRFTGKV